MPEHLTNKHPQLRDIAGRLAQSFDSAEGERILRLITQLSASPDGSSTEELKKSGDTPGKLRVGIWEAKDEASGRSFVRVETGEPWHLWANVQEIPPKGLSHRVVLIGESVARGYLYDPHFTPALALQKMMDAACGTAEIEVVDLARSDLCTNQLRELITQALHLEPDALVIFAGNNWFPLIKTDDERLLDMVSAFRNTGSWRGVKESCESFLITNTRKTLRLLGEVARERGIPVVFVLPEFNLADWRTEYDCPPLLTSEQTEAWLRAKDEAEQLLKGNDWEKAESLGERLLQLDQGTTAAGPYILAEVSQKRGDHQAARSFLRWRAMSSFTGLLDTLRGATQSYSRRCAKKRLLTAFTSSICHANSLDILVARQQTAGCFSITAISHSRASGSRWLSLLRGCYRC